MAHDADAQVKRLDFSLPGAETDSTEQVARGAKRSILEMGIWETYGIG